MFQAQPFGILWVSCLVVSSMAYTSYSSLRRSYGPSSFPRHTRNTYGPSIPGSTYGLSTQQRATYATSSPPRAVYDSQPLNCGDGFVVKADGTCARPLINRNIFLYQSPRLQYTQSLPLNIPDPQINYNYVFIKSPSSVVGPNPIVVPPPKQKTLVYVLSEEPKAQSQQIIEIPSDISEPEVFFINYRDGENPALPGGIDLQTAISQAAHPNFIPGVVDSEDSVETSYRALVDPNLSSQFTSYSGTSNSFSATSNSNFAPSSSYSQPAASISAGIGTIVNAGISSNRGRSQSQVGSRLPNLIGQKLHSTDAGRNIFVNKHNQKSSYV